MALRKVYGLNSIVALLIMLGLIVVLIVSIFILVTAFPDAFGSLPPEYETREVYSFEPWTFELNGLSVSYPEGGAIIPLYREEKQEAVLIVAAGQYRSGREKIPVDNPAGIFIEIEQEAFEEQRGDIIFVPVEDIVARNALMHIYARQPGLPVFWQKVIPLSFVPRQGSIFYYFLSPDGAPVLPPTLIDRRGNRYAAAAIYTMFFGIVLLVLYMFSLDFQPSRYWQFIHRTPPGSAALAAVPAAAALALGSELLPSLYEWPEYTLAAGYLAAAAGLVVLALLKKIDFLDFGLRPEMMRHGYIMAAAAALIFLIMARDIPRRFTWDGSSTLVEFLILLLLAGLTREMIWRGFIQTTLGRQFGAAAGLGLTVILAGLVHLATMYVTAPWLLQYPYSYIEAVILMPGVAAVLGFLYLRTENIISCALLHTLLIFLPRIIAG